MHLQLRQSHCDEVQLITVLLIDQKELCFCIYFKSFVRVLLLVSSYIYPEIIYSASFYFKSFKKDLYLFVLKATKNEVNNCASNINWKM